MPDGSIAPAKQGLFDERTAKQAIRSQCTADQANVGQGSRRRPRRNVCLENLGHRGRRCRRGVL